MAEPEEETEPEERIAVDGNPVSDEAFAGLFDKALEAARRMEKEGLQHPTFFEFLLGMGLCAFRDAGVEYAILETGLGGRLDATSAVEPPEVCVITSVGYDHMQYLGNTLGEIAAEKAESCGCFCKKIGKDAYEILGTENKCIAFSCTSDYYGTTTWKLNNIGKYQPGNALLAMETVRGLMGADAHPERWREALADVRWPGRMEEVVPGVYVDGAHNVSAVEAFAQSIADDGKEKIIVFSAVKDKEYEKMAEILCRQVNAGLYVVTRIDDPRGADLEQLGAVFRKYTDRAVEIRPSVKEALACAMEHRDGRRVYCLGSLYLTGMIKKLIQEVA